MSEFADKAAAQAYLAELHQAQRDALTTPSSATVTDSTGTQSYTRADPSEIRREIERVSRIIRAFDDAEAGASNPGFMVGRPS